MAKRKAKQKSSSGNAKQMGEIELFTGEIQSHYARIKQSAKEAQFWYEHYIDDLQKAYKQKLRGIDNKYAREEKALENRLQANKKAIEKTFQDNKRKAENQLHELRSSFRWIVLPWGDSAWDTYDAKLNRLIPSAVRTGRLSMPDEINIGDIPALVPLFEKGHIFLTGAEVDETRHILQSIILRLLLSYPPGTLRLRLVDALAMGAEFSAFLRLPELLRGEKVSSREDEIARQLDLLDKHIETVIQTRLQNIYPSLEAYNEQAGEIAVPYHFLTIADFPAGFNDRMAQVLLRIAKNGPRAGVYLLVSVNKSLESPRDFDISDLTSLGSVLNLTDQFLGWEVPDFGKYPIIPDHMPASDKVNKLLDVVKVAFGQMSQSLGFKKIAIAEKEIWKGETTYGFNVPIGISGTGEVHDLEMGREGVIHHGLIGGTTGSGKSNLLHVIINQLALHYSPDELAIYLLDFKEGVEFQDYLALPHARVVGIESEREFGRSVLRYLEAEIERRGRLFKTAGVNDLITYRQTTKQKLPRLLLLMDEFQVLFGDIRQEDIIARDSGQILEDLVKRGRSFGIHVLLSSQSPSAAGSYGNSIYKQMGLRIALRCLPQEAQAILGEGNFAASESLEQPGEAIYNDEMGRKEKNVQIRVGLLSPGERGSYKKLIQKHAKSKPYETPITFEGRAVARLEANAELTAHLRQASWAKLLPAVHVWLGEPIEIKNPTAATLDRYARSNLIILGGSELQAYGLLLSSLVSLAGQQSPEEAGFIIADFARPESPIFNLFANLSIPHKMDIAGPRQAEERLTQLITILDNRLQGESSKLNLYFLIAGVHRWRELRSAEQFTQSESAKKLTRISEEGPEVGIHLIAWADAFAAFERAFKRSGASNFDLRVALHLSEQDSIALFDVNAAAKLGENRAIYRYEDWEMGRLEKFKPYPVPDRTVLENIVGRIKAKGLLDKEEER